VGHQLAVPELGNYYALPHEGEGRALVRSAQGVELISNVCRHRQAVMLKGRGSLNASGPSVASGNIVCPLHRWTYSPSGQLLGAPHFSQDPCLNLNNYKLREWNGLLFEDNGLDIEADLANMGPRAALSFEGFALDRVELHECNYNWKTFIEVYLEDYHVGPFHPGLGQFVTCDDLSWEFKDNYSVQTVGVSSGFGKPGSPTYQTWHDVLLKYRNGQLPEQGAIWLKVNGQTKQSANLNQMIWSVAEQISKLSEAFERFPGDIIYSGTPENVGPVVRGDVIEMHIDGLPNLSVRIV
jgi:choline monooxygenase